MFYGTRMFNNMFTNFCYWLLSRARLIHFLLSYASFLRFVSIFFLLQWIILRNYLKLHYIVPDRTTIEELEIIWQEAAVAYSRHYPSRKNKNLNQDEGCSAEIRNEHLSDKNQKYFRYFKPFDHFNIILPSTLYLLSSLFYSSFHFKILCVFLFIHMHATFLSVSFSLISSA